MHELVKLGPFVVGLIAGLIWQNAALALIGGIATRLLMIENPVPHSAAIGKLSLQAAIVLLGFTLGVQQLVAVNVQYGLVIAIYVFSTFSLGAVLAMFMNADKTERTLVTGGTAICGGTAIAAIAPLLNARPQKFAVAIALVFLLNVIAVLVFPSIGRLLDLSQETFGAWVALAVHDTSSVIATASLYGDEALQVATTVKLTRTLWLIPLTIFLSVYVRREKASFKLPLFVVLFAAAAVVSALVTIPPTFLTAIGMVSKCLLVVALAMVGLDISRSTVRAISPKSLMFAVALWLMVAPLALLLVI